jgi:hypothetical protein
LCECFFSLKVLFQFHMTSLFLLLKEVHQFKHHEAVVLLFRLQQIWLIRNFCSAFHGAIEELKWESFGGKKRECHAYGYFAAPHI